MRLSLALGFAAVGTAHACNTKGSWGSLGCSVLLWVCAATAMGQGCHDECWYLMLLEVMGMSHGSPRAPLSLLDQGLRQICFSPVLWPPRDCSGVELSGEHLKFQWFWSLAG